MTPVLQEGLEGPGGPGALEWEAGGLGSTSPDLVLAMVGGGALRGKAKDKECIDKLGHLIKGMTIKSLGGDLSLLPSHQGL